MDVALAKLVQALANYGPGFIFGGVCLGLMIIDRKSNRAQLNEERQLFSKELGEERKKNEKLADKIIEISAASIRADAEQTAALESLEKLVLHSRRI